jgi:Galactose oxidase-like, Early set domain/Glyoxal oxidase N-terminus
MIPIRSTHHLWTLGRWFVPATFVVAYVVLSGCAKRPSAPPSAPTEEAWPKLPDEAPITLEVGDSSDDTSRVQLGFLEGVGADQKGVPVASRGSSFRLTLANSSSRDVNVIILTSYERVQLEVVSGGLVSSPDGAFGGTIPAMGTAVLRGTATGVGEPEEPGDEIEIHSQAGGVDRVEAWIVPLLGEWRNGRDDGGELDLGMVAVHAAMVRNGDSAQILFLSPPRVKNRDGSLKKRTLVFPNRGGGYYWKIWRVNDVEIALWDLASQRLETRSMDEPQNLFCSGHAHLADGRLLVAGGHIGLTGHNADRIHLFDGASAQHAWTRVSTKLPETRWYPTVTALPDGKMLITSGRGAPLLGNLLDEFLGWYKTTRRTYEIFDPVTSTLAEIPSPENVFVDDDKLATYPSVVVLPGGQSFPDGLVFAQERTNAWLFGYRPANGGRVERLSTTPYAMKTMGSRSYPYYGSAVLLPFDADAAHRFRVLIVGGQDETNPNHEDYSETQKPTATAEVFSVDNTVAPDRQEGWKPAGSMNHARVLPSATQLADGTVLVTGGASMGWANCNSGDVLSTELYDPEATGARFVQMAPARIGRRYHSTAMLLPDGTLLSAGSTGGFNLDDSCIDPQFVAERFYPPYLWRGARPVIRTLSPVDIELGATWAIEVESAALAGLRLALVRLPSVTHGNNMDQRYLWLAERGRAPIPGGVRLTVAAPRDGTVAPPGDYMLFVLDGAGVPSHARLVRLLGR